MVIVYTVTDTTFRKTQPSLLKVYHLGELQAGRCNIYRTLASVRNGLHKPKDFRWQTSNPAGPLPPLCGFSLEGNQTSAWGLLVGLPQAYKLKTSSLRNPSSNCSSSVFETTFACAPHPHILVFSKAEHGSHLHFVAETFDTACLYISPLFPQFLLGRALWLEWINKL